MSGTEKGLTVAVFLMAMGWVTGLLADQQRIILTKDEWHCLKGTDGTCKVYVHVGEAP